MHFPQKKNPLIYLLKRLETLSEEEKIHELELFLEPEQAKKHALEYGIYHIEEEYRIRERELEFLLRQIQDARQHCYMMEPATDKSDIKGYKNLHIFLFSHPNNHSHAAIEILSNMNYLDKMTRNVAFTMPGYKIASKDERIINSRDTKMPLSFDEDIFIAFVQELEDKTKGKFAYQNDCELVVVGQRPNGEYDTETMAKINIDRLAKQKCIDPVKLLMAISQKFRNDNSEIINARQLVNEIIGELCTEDEKPIYKVFIAGAKKMVDERRIIREQLGKLANEYDLDIRTFTFEDFPTPLTGGERGRQADYNRFIREEANAVVFIFGSIAGRITEEEFDVAYQSLKNNQHPDIFVYVRKQFFIFDKRLRNIKNRVFGENQEYYIEYKNLDNLCYLLYSNMNTHLKSKHGKKA